MIAVGRYTQVFARLSARAKLSSAFVADIRKLGFRKKHLVPDEA